MNADHPQHQAVLKTLRDAGLSMTVPRLGVIQTLAEAPEAITAEDIFKVLMASGTPASVATVYRVLKELEQLGVVRRHLRRSINGAKSIYEIIDTAAAAVAQLSCPGCNKSMALDAKAVVKAVAPLARKSGFALGNGPIQIETLCAECARARGRSARPAAN